MLDVDFPEQLDKTCMIIQRADGFSSAVVNRWDLKGRVLPSAKHNFQAVVFSWDVSIELRGFS